MKTIAYLTLVGGLALACAFPAFAGPIGDDEGGGGVSESFTAPPAAPPLGPDITNYLNSLPPDAGDGAASISYDTSSYVPTSTDTLGDLNISWNDIAGVTTGAYDQYWLTHTAPPPQPVLLQPHHRFFNAPTGNLGESDAAGEGYMFSVTARSVKFVQLVPEPAPLMLLSIGLAALALLRRRSGSQ